MEKQLQEEMAALKAQLITVNLRRRVLLTQNTML